MRVRRSPHGGDRNEFGCCALEALRYARAENEVAGRCLFAANNDSVVPPLLCKTALYRDFETGVDVRLQPAHRCRFAASSCVLRCIDRTTKTVGGKTGKDGNRGMFGSPFKPEWRRPSSLRAKAHPATHSPATVRFRMPSRKAHRRLHYLDRQASASHRAYASASVGRVRGSMRSNSRLTMP